MFARQFSPAFLKVAIASLTLFATSLPSPRAQAALSVEDVAEAHTLNYFDLTDAEQDELAASLDEASVEAFTIIYDEENGSASLVRGKIEARQEDAADEVETACYGCGFPRGNHPTNYFYPPRGGRHRGSIVVPAPVIVPVPVLPLVGNTRYCQSIGSGQISTSLTPVFVVGAPCEFVLRQRHRGEWVNVVYDDGIGIIP